MVKDLNPQPAAIAVRALLPGTLVLLFSVIVLLPSGGNILGRIPLSLPLVFVFYWTLFEEDCAPWFFIVLLGLLHDLWSEAIVGLTPLLLLGFRLVVRSLRLDLINLDFFSRWFVFAILTAVYFTAFLTVIENALVVPGVHLDLLGRWAVACAIYPLANALFFVLHHKVLFPRRRS